MARRRKGAEGAPLPRRMDALNTASATIPTGISPNKMIQCLLALVLVALWLAPATAAQMLTPNIVNGTRADPRRFPFMAAIQYNMPNINYRRVFCGGSMIAPNLMLTAAHCSRDLFQPVNQLLVSSRRFDIRRSSDDPKEIRMTGGGIDYSVESVFIHPLFDPIKLTFDIAIWVLKPKLPLSYNSTFSAKDIPIVALPTVRNKNPPEATRVKAMGWGSTLGMTLNSSLSPFLLTTWLKTTSLSYCASANHAVLNYSVICAMGDGTDTCTGDSGGPLLTRNPNPVRGSRWFTTTPGWTQVGIVSWGPKLCALPGVPAVYTGISWYLPWINLIRRRYQIKEPVTTTKRVMRKTTRRRSNATPVSAPDGTNLTPNPIIVNPIRPG